MPTKTAKPVVIFVPGLGTTGETYTPLLDALRHDFDVRVAMHSLTVPEHPDWDFFFEAIDAASAGATKFILFGHSMGGAISLAYASTRPKRVSKTIAIAPPAFPVFGDRTYRGLEKFRIYRRLHNSVIAAMHGHLLHAFQSLRIRHTVLAEGRRRKLYDWINRLDLAPVLAKARSAVVLWPEHEEIVRVETVRRIEREFPNIRVRYVPGTHNNAALGPESLLPIIQEELRG